MENANFIIGFIGLVISLGFCLHYFGWEPKKNRISSYELSKSLREIRKSAQKNDRDIKSQIRKINDQS